MKKGHTQGLLVMLNKSKQETHRQEDRQTDKESASATLRTSDAEAETPEAVVF
jgi:hypothetical protein